MCPANKVEQNRNALQLLENNCQSGRIVTSRCSASYCTSLVSTSETSLVRWYLACAEHIQLEEKKYIYTYLVLFSCYPLISSSTENKKSEFLFLLQAFYFEHLAKRAIQYANVDLAACEYVGTGVQKALSFHWDINPSSLAVSVLEYLLWGNAIILRMFFVSVRQTRVVFLLIILELRSKCLNLGNCKGSASQ